jgi:hypothetical protein
MKNISKEVLNKIRDEKILPEPKWKFLINKYLIWSLFAINILIGSIGLSISIYLFTNNDLSSIDSFWQKIFYTFPFFWIAITSLFIFITYYNFKHTEKGYKFSFAKCISLNFLIIFIIGILLNVFGFAGQINQSLDQNIPYYSQFADMRTMMWSRPDEGYLSGEITNIDKNNNVICLKDFDGKKWNVSYDSKTIIRSRISLVIGEEIKVLGNISGNSNFTATEIRPWNGMMDGNNSMMQENRGMMRSNY